MTNGSFTVGGDLSKIQAMTCDTVIIGGGLSGLAAGVKLKGGGERVIVLDRNELPGGVVRTSTQDGYLVEAGPNTLMVDDQRILSLMDELGLSDHLVETSPDARRRYLVKEGRVWEVPSSMTSLITTPLFTLPGKLRLLTEPFRAKSTEPDESLADFVSRRLGVEVLEQAVQPIISGVYAGDPERLSVKYALPALHRMEQESGSLLAGGLRKRMHPSPYTVKRRLVSFDSGLATLPVTMAMVLGESYVSGVEVQDIAQREGHWCVTWGDGTGDGERMQVEARRLVLAVPAYALENLPLPGALTQAVRGLTGISYAPVSVVALGFDRAAVRHKLDGFGVLVPDREKLPVLGTLFSSTLFPGRAPEGKVLLTSFVGGRIHPQRAQGEDCKLIEQVVSALRVLLGVNGDPEFYQIHRWSRAIPQMETGHGRYMKIMDQLEKDWRGLTFLGNFRHGISAPQCLLAGLEV